MQTDDAHRWFDPTGALGRLRHALALIVAAHGVAHLVGTSQAIGAIEVDSDLEYLFGAWSVSDEVLLWTWAVVWVAITGLWLLTAVAVWADRPGWPILTIGASGLSLTLCVVALPPTVIGIAVNIALVIVAVLVRRSAWSDPADPGSPAHHHLTGARPRQ